MYRSLFLKSLFGGVMCFLLGSYSMLFAQTLGGEVEFTDYRPIYRKSKDIYILDKIEYRKERMVFFFRFVDDNGSYTSFYGQENEFAWFLQKVGDRSKRHKLIEIRNIRRNDTLQLAALPNDKKAQYRTKAGDIMTCEIHFNRLPINTTRVNLIEGIGQESNKSHFNCFDIRIKPLGSGDLGEKTDMTERIEDFGSPEKAMLVPEFLPLVNKLRGEHGFCSRQRVPAAPKLEWDDQLAQTARQLILKLWKAKSLTTSSGSKTIIARLGEQGYQTNLAYEVLIFDAESPEDALGRWQRLGAQCMRIRDGRLRVMGAARKGKYWLMVLAR